MDGGHRAATRPTAQAGGWWGWWAAPASDRASEAAAPRPPGEEGVGRERDDGWPGARVGVTLRQRQPEGRPAVLPTQRAADAHFWPTGLQLSVPDRPGAPPRPTRFSLLNARCGGYRGAFTVRGRACDHVGWGAVARPRCPRRVLRARRDTATGARNSKSRATAQGHRAVCYTHCSPTAGT